MEIKLNQEREQSFLYDYLNNFSPTGNEVSGQKLWLGYLEEFVDTWEQDAYGSVFGIINPNNPYKVVIEAHADEIAWYVNHITKEGFIYVVRNGGSDHMIAPSKQVLVHTDKGLVPGVFGWPAIHTRKIKDNITPQVEKIFIDVGAKDADEVKSMGIDIGCVVTFNDEFSELNDRYYVGRALDNRLGGFAISQVARLLKENQIELPYSLYIVNAVQEEIGLRGAQMVAERIQPDVAIVTDVTHDTHTPMISQVKHGSIKTGLGPSVTFAPAVQQNLLKFVMDIAKENEIPYQREAASRSTGTDTDAFAYSNQGVPSCLISLPLRYMHTTVEMAHKDDLKNLIKWLYFICTQIKKDQSFLYF